MSEAKALGVLPRSLRFPWWPEGAQRGHLGKGDSTSVPETEAGLTPSPANRPGELAFGAGHSTLYTGHS